jgi:hypothetical protein
MKIGGVEPLSDIKILWSAHLRKNCMSTIMMHIYQNTLLKWTILGNDFGQWQPHIIYNLYTLASPDAITNNFDDIDRGIW